MPKPSAASKKTVASKATKKAGPKEASDAKSRRPAAPARKPAASRAKKEASGADAIKCSGKTLEDYLAAVPAHLRDLANAVHLAVCAGNASVDPTVKWGSPHYTAKGAVSKGFWNLMGGWSCDTAGTLSAWWGVANGTVLPPADAAALPLQSPGKHKMGYGRKITSSADIDKPLFARMTALAVACAQGPTPYD